MSRLTDASLGYPTKSKKVVSYFNISMEFVIHETFLVFIDSNTNATQYEYTPKDANEVSEDNCDVYIDISLDGLSIVYLRVESLDNHHDYEVLIPDIVFSFSPDDFVSKPF